MNLVCFTEEQSAKEMLDIILPKLISGTSYQIIHFEGKQDLEKNIGLKLKNWCTPDTVFLITRDQDSGDCQTIKQDLLTKINHAGKKDVSLVRIACRELESFYLGDWQAVKQGLKLSKVPNQANRKYRNPDNLANAKEELIKYTNKIYQPISGSKLISPYLKLDGSNKSTSFNFLLSGITKLCTTKP
ncbi:hypothetical protein MNB_SUP05-SYMBIONT-4-722 [hydrothermal vent metagenome]|uniref:DUF4276 family protein n=1 Tax=hydrothermal vent metagenome TaxID=652676 RepID=A0A1W1DXM9_9ZZZZ